MQDGNWRIRFSLLIGEIAIQEAEGRADVRLFISSLRVLNLAVHAPLAGFLP